MSLFNASSQYSVSCSYAIRKFKVFSFLPFSLSHIVVPILRIFLPYFLASFLLEKKHRSLCIQQWCAGLATGILSQAGMASLFLALKGQANLLLLWFFFFSFSPTLVVPMRTFFLIGNLHTFTRQLSRTLVTLCQSQVFWLLAHWQFTVKCIPYLILPKCGMQVKSSFKQFPMKCKRMAAAV